MVMYDPADGYQDPYGQGGEQVPGGSGGCGGGSVLSELDTDGNWVGNIAGTQGECVDPAEAARRRAITVNQPFEGEGSNQAGKAAAKAGGGTPAVRPNYGPAPMFTAPTWTAPQFSWGEQWNAPSEAEALNDPGYQFRLNEGTRALEQSAAAKGHLLTGGTLKDITGWGQNFAKQEYGDVFNRNLTGYNTRFDAAKDTFDRNYGGSRDQFDRFYTGKKDEFAPRLFEWQTNAHGADLGFAQNWLNYWKNNLSAQDIWNSPNG